MKKHLQRSILLFRQDLRLKDNQALYHAINESSEVIPLYIFDENDQNEFKIGSAQKWWLYHSLTSLSNSITKKSGNFIFKKGNAKEILISLFKETKAKYLYLNNCHEPFVIEQDKIIEKSLELLDVKTKFYESTLLFDPKKIKTKQGDYFKVYTPFFNECVTNWNPRKPLSDINEFNFSQLNIKSDDLNDWNLLPTKPNWAKGFENIWEPGEEGAEKKIQIFLNYIKDYKNSRDRPDNENGTSHLSPHLHFGEISSADIWLAVSRECHLPNLKKKETGPEVFLSQIVWREYFYHLIHVFPNLGSENYNSKYNKFRWINNENDLIAWKKGLTGYPIVDAGMRELWRTGYMHNRLRMIVGSFLVKDLLIDWREGEKWFWDTLLDADLPNNAGGWQWIAGSGTDAAQYTRVFNPTLQSEKFDPNCEYIKKWIPELKDLPNEHIHAPWKTPQQVLKKIGLEFGKDYPKPIVDHTEARLRALEHYDDIRVKVEKSKPTTQTKSKSKKLKK
eukprot:gene11771-5109_t